ncbi:hypothetical protein PNEG_00061 [Pneumocystis murina B123]|uniref:MICOS complex subunit MIC10 n=1 Tax=Pneumocystis murina (strain B123) TaxID=1069680 RepID=M7NWE9_PNEMU|nr:hypothetical protein PNEG_00061 [Pneumocystis murina B123]EMR11622.1 hypothetical protein PNEG_00061 [Pneumocystis murina B123]
MVQTKTSYSEDIFGEKWDLCLSNAIVNAGIGLGSGIIASVCLFKRKMWPAMLGFGFGLGKAYSDCDRQFNPYSIPGFQIQKSNK